MEFRVAFKIHSFSQGTPYWIPKVQDVAVQICSTDGARTHIQTGSNRGSKLQATGNSSIHLLIFLVTLLLGASMECQAQTLQRPSQMSRDEQIEEAADHFEGLMMQRLYEQMWSSQRLVSPGDDNPFAPSHAEEIYAGMLREEVAKKLADQRTLGIGDLVAAQLKGTVGIGNRALVESNRKRQEGVSHGNQ